MGTALIWMKKCHWSAEVARSKSADITFWGLLSRYEQRGDPCKHGPPLVFQPGRQANKKIENPDMINHLYRAGHQAGSGALYNHSIKTWATWCFSIPINISVYFSGGFLLVIDFVSLKVHSCWSWVDPHWRDSPCSRNRFWLSSTDTSWKGDEINWLWQKWKKQRRKYVKSASRWFWRFQALPTPQIQDLTITWSSRHLTLLW